MAINRCLLCMICLAVASAASAQQIRGHYVSKSEQDGTIYHTFPVTLFESREAGDLTFDITCKQGRDSAVVNFTYVMDRMTPADSIRFVSGRSVLAGAVGKIYIEPTKKQWKHRYTFSVPVGPLYTFFDEHELPRAVLYAGGREYPFEVRRSAWRSYAPVGYKIFEMIRVNEP